METNCKLKQLLQEEQEAKAAASSMSRSEPVPPPPPTSAVEVRNWLELPELPLHNIFSRLLTTSPDFPDILSFSAVCRSWAFLSSPATSFLTSSFPPLLLLPREQTLRTLQTQRSFQSRVPPETLVGFPSCNIGYSHGHLLFLSSRCPLLLVNVLTCKLTFLPSPPTDSPRFRLAILTPSSLLLLLDWDSQLLLFRPDTASWSRVHSDLEITSLVLYRGRLFALNAFPTLTVLDLSRMDMAGSTCSCSYRPPTTSSTAPAGA